MKKDRVVVFGGGGFLGQHFVETFRRHGTPLLIVDNQPPRFALAENESFHPGDIRDESTFQGLLAPGDRILHLAAAHHDWGISRETFFAVNAAGTARICDAAAAAGVNDICFLSSVAVYGAGSGTHTEDDPCIPTGNYGASKLAGEQVLRDWAGDGVGRKLLVIRPSMTFGPYNFANMYGLMSQIHAGRYLSVGPGVNRKSIGYAGNVVDATLFHWSRDDLGTVEVYNYADKPDLSSRRLEQVVAAAVGRKLPAVRLPYPMVQLVLTPVDALGRVVGKDVGISLARVRKFAIDETVYDCGKIFSSGFQPRWTLEEGIGKTADWFLREGATLTREARRPVVRPDDARLAAPWLHPQAMEQAAPQVA